MAKLTTAKRTALSEEDLALPAQRKYPVMEKQPAGAVNLSPAAAIRIRAKAKKLLR